MKMTSLYGRIHQRLEHVEALVGVQDSIIQMEQMNVGLQQIRTQRLHFGLKSMDVLQILLITIANVILLKDGLWIQMVVLIANLML